MSNVINPGFNNESSDSKGGGLALATIVYLTLAVGSLIFLIPALLSGGSITFIIGATLLFGVGLFIGFLGLWTVSSIIRLRSAEAKPGAQTATALYLHSRDISIRFKSLNGQSGWVALSWVGPQGDIGHVCQQTPEFWCGGAPLGLRSALLFSKKAAVFGWIAIAAGAALILFR